MDVEQLTNDLDEGQIDAGRLIELLGSAQRQLHETKQQLDATQRQLDAANERIAALEKKIGESPTAKVDEPFSVREEEKRQEQRGKKKRRKPKSKKRKGRVTTADKIARAVRTEKVYPAGIPEEDCTLSHTRPVWRLENGQAQIVAYEVYRGPKSRYGSIPGVLGRSEFGIEIVITIAYLVYLVGLSFDKVCLVLNFFQNLSLSKSQADALLNQLSRHWENEFEVLCTLLANSAVVHADETSWSINSVWAFLSEKVRLLFFGVHKNAATLEQILDPATFAGIVISDDAAVYADFTNSQKCWAHLLRKAIKLTLLEPDNQEYRRFTDRLLEIYREACRLQRDRRLGDEGRKRKVAALEDELLELCWPVWIEELPPLEGTANDYRLLVNELVRLLLRQQLFTFVTAAAVEQPNGEVSPVGGTNNEAERSLRNPAADRGSGRTNKTPRGGRRRTVIQSVLESLSLHLATFTLSSVIDEVKRWFDHGRSCFTDLLVKLDLPPPEQSILDAVLPSTAATSGSTG
jgi:hypothetical protein